MSDSTIGFRLPDELIQRLDAHAKRLETRTPGVRFSRTAALKALLTRALGEEEAEAQRSPQTQTASASETSGATKVRKTRRTRSPK